MKILSLKHVLGVMILITTYNNIPQHTDYIYIRQTPLHYLALTLIVYAITLLVSNLSNTHVVLILASSNLSVGH
jgi:hypothetical protein